MSDLSNYQILDLPVIKIPKKFSVNRSIDKKILERIVISIKSLKLNQYFLKKLTKQIPTKITLSEYKEYLKLLKKQTMGMITMKRFSSSTYFAFSHGGCIYSRRGIYREGKSLGILAHEFGHLIQGDIFYSMNIFSGMRLYYPKSLILMKELNASWRGYRSLSKIFGIKKALQIIHHSRLLFSFCAYLFR